MTAQARQTLLEQIARWHADGGHEQIAKTLLALPPADRDYTLACFLARALNNLSRYADALAILETVRDQGQADALWHFRTGYSLFYLDGREAEAIPYFERAIALGDDYPNTYELLLSAKKYAKKHWDENPGKKTAAQPAAPFTPKAHATLHLNMRLSPQARSSRVEDGLDLMLRAKNLGHVTGGDTQRTPEGEPASCTVEIALADDTEPARRALFAAAEKLEIAKGSKLKYRPAHSRASAEYPIGKLEGFALYLNGTDLPDEVYKNNDPRELRDQLCAALSRNGAMIYSSWAGPKETALYFYGEGRVEAMLAKAQPIIATHPLCQNSRIVPLT